MLALPNRRKSLDFVHNQFVTGRRFKMLNFFDNMARECLLAVMGVSVTGWWILRELSVLIAERGRPR